MFDKLNKKAIVIVLSASIIAFLLLGFFTIRNILGDGDAIFSIRPEVPPNQNRIVLNNDHLDLIFSPLPKYGYEGFSVGIYESEWNGDIRLEEGQEYITIQVNNAGFADLNLLLKVFYNYEELDFQIVGTSETKTELLFILEGNHQVHIPIYLPEILEDFANKDSISKLTIGVFFEPEYFVINEPILSERLPLTALMLNYEINYGLNANLILRTAPVIPSGEEPFVGFSVYTEPEPPGCGGLWGRNYVVAQRGRPLELTFFANEELNAEKYLIVSMLDWYQIPMNGEPYLWVETPNAQQGMGQYGTFTIEVPDEVGFYEFFAFLVPHPTSPHAAHTFFPLETRRFTIEVIE